MGSLNDQERRFAQELVKGLSIAEAARVAGYAESTATSKAATWTQVGNSQYKPELAAYIEELREKIESDKIASASEVLQYFTRVLRTDISEVSEFDGYALRPKGYDEMTEEARGVLDSIEWTKGQYAKVGMASKMNAAKELAKYHRLTTNTNIELMGKVEHSAKEDYTKLTKEEKRQLLLLKRKANGQGGKITD